MVYHVYILYSEKIDRFYVGNTELKVLERLAQHNQGLNKNAFTIKGRPWTLFHSFSCESRRQARQIERHIKKMKSKKYILNLKNYPEIKQKLLTRFKSDS